MSTSTLDQVKNVKGQRQEVLLSNEPCKANSATS